jgi:hypothetical protein
VPIFKLTPALDDESEHPVNTNEETATIKPGKIHLFLFVIFLLVVILASTSKKVECATTYFSPCATQKTDIL